MAAMADETGLDKNPANYVPLSPLSHLRRARDVFGQREALVYGDRRYNWSEVHERCSRLASALSSMGIKPGDVVSAVCPNIPAIAEAHFGVPAAGAVLNAINVRLDPDTIAYVFEHCDARIALVDSQFLPTVQRALELMDGPGPDLIEVADPSAGFPATGEYQEYEDLLASGEPSFTWHDPEDEWDSISLNYTSGTTGRPKGVVCHHRGAYLMTMGTVISWEMTLYPRFLAVVPLFHCNGWCHTWMMPLVGGTIICCRNINAESIFGAIRDERITHFGGAPIVLNMLVNAPDAVRVGFDHEIRVFTAGAPPSPSTIKAVEELGFTIMQVYGLTETYGHVTECLHPAEWQGIGSEERYARMARQGIRIPVMENIDVVDQETREPVPHDGKTLGEVIMTGNTVMRGYYRNPEATSEAFAGGSFRTGDIAYRDEAGYIQITDRLKDIIISGGENVSSVEVEATLMAHPAVSLCAVVARPDAKWGETPCAFVELKENMVAGEAELIAFCRERLAGFKTPKSVFFQELPKTSTGKIQKFQLRQQAKSM